VNEKEIFIDEDELKEYFFTALTLLGYAVKEEEAEVIAALAFDYLVALDIIELED
jgi:hypothetical protein